MNVKRIFSALIICFGLIFMLAGCKNYTITIEGLTNVFIGEEVQLTAYLETDNGKDSNYQFIWESEHPNIATVDDTGKVCGLTQGETTIYASYDKFQGKITINVVEKTNLTKTVLKQPKVVTNELLTGEKIELALYEENVGYVESEFNPYDYDQINVYAVFHSPSGKELVMPAFWYRDYEITINEKYTGEIQGISGMASTNPNEIQGQESVKWTEEEYHYRVRVSLDEVGEYTYYINVEENGALVQTMQNKLTVKECTNSNNRGIIQVDTNTNTNFIYGDGTSFIPVGVNLCWWTSSTRKTYDYNVWLNELNKNNANMARIWMAPWGFSIHSGKSYNNFNDRLNMAARLDKVFDLADENSVYLQLCLINHGQFSTGVNPTWDTNPYKKVVDSNGNVKKGIIDTPDQFFKNAECKRTYKNELRYLIGRYGYSDKIMAWELFNEVDWTDGGDTTNKTNIYNWHKEMGEFVDSTDPYNHMITTSYKTNTGMAYFLNCIDYTCPHDYGYSGKNINTNLPASMRSVVEKYKKPTMQSEVGINWESGTATAKVDPTGISIRQGLWSGMMGGTAGGAMQWWWDSWIHPKKLWHVFNGAGIYAKEMDLTGKYTLVEKNATISNSKISIMGYQYDDRIYGYVYDNTWWYKNSDVDQQEAAINITATNGTYEFTIYNTVSGAIESTNTVTIDNGVFNVNMTVKEDSAFILKKI